MVGFGRREPSSECYRSDRSCLLLRRHGNNQVFTTLSPYGHDTVDSFVKREDKLSNGNISLTHNGRPGLDVRARYCTSARLHGFTKTGKRPQTLCLAWSPCTSTVSLLHRESYASARKPTKKKGRKLEQEIRVDCISQKEVQRESTKKQKKHTHTKKEV